MYFEMYNCQKCLAVRKDDIKASREFRATKGCFARTKNPITYMEDGTKVYMCLGRMYGAKEIMLIEEYKMFRDHKIFPKPGHLINQNSKTIEAFYFIEQEMRESLEILDRKKKDGK